jgi:hypothetical protein
VWRASFNTGQETGSLIRKADKTQTERREIHAMAQTTL